MTNKLTILILLSLIGMGCKTESDKKLIFHRARFDYYSKKIDDKRLSLDLRFKYLDTLYMHLDSIYKYSGLNYNK